jgi:hypothetical protein
MFRYLLNFQKLIILKFTSDNFLTSTIETIIDQFLPDSLRKFRLKNLKLTGEYKKISDAIPKFLHGRPESYVKHIYTFYCSKYIF